MILTTITDRYATHFDLETLISSPFYSQRGREGGCGYASKKVKGHRGQYLGSLFRVDEPVRVILKLMGWYVWFFSS